MKDVLFRSIHSRILDAVADDGDAVAAAKWIAAVIDDHYEHAQAIVQPEQWQAFCDEELDDLADRYAPFRSDLELAAKMALSRFANTIVDDRRQRTPAGTDGPRTDDAAATEG